MASLRVGRFMVTCALLVLAACGSDEAAPPAAPPTETTHTLTVKANIGVWSDLQAQPKRPRATGVDCTSYDFEKHRVQVLDGSGNILGVAQFPRVGTWTKSDPENTAAAYQWDGT